MAYSSFEKCTTSVADAKGSALSVDMAEGSFRWSLPLFELKSVFFGEGNTASANGQVFLNTVSFEEQLSWRDFDYSPKDSVSLRMKEKDKEELLDVAEEIEAAKKKEEDESGGDPDDPPIPDEEPDDRTIVYVSLAKGSSQNNCLSSQTPCFSFKNALAVSPGEEKTIILLDKGELTDTLISSIDSATLCKGQRAKGGQAALGITVETGNPIFILQDLEFRTMTVSLGYIEEHPTSYFRLYQHSLKFIECLLTLRNPAAPLSAVAILYGSTFRLTPPFGKINQLTLAQNFIILWPLADESNPNEETQATVEVSGLELSTRDTGEYAQSPYLVRCYQGFAGANEVEYTRLLRLNVTLSNIAILGNGSPLVTLDMLDFPMVLTGSIKNTSSTHVFTPGVQVTIYTGTLLVTDMTIKRCKATGECSFGALYVSTVVDADTPHKSGFLKISNVHFGKGNGRAPGRGKDLYILVGPSDEVTAADIVFSSASGGGSAVIAQAFGSGDE